jgi:hypothetical protein
MLLYIALLTANHPSLTMNLGWWYTYKYFFFSPKRLMTKRMIKVQGTLIRVGRTFYRVIRDYYFFEFIGKNIYLCISTTFTSKHTRTLEWNVQLVMRSCGWLAAWRFIQRSSSVPLRLDLNSIPSLVASWNQTLYRHWTRVAQVMGPDYMWYWRAWEHSEK